MPVYLVDGEYENIKITRPTDLLLAAAIIQQSSSLDPS
jgi:2-C-methyl-D-erythritol 4-phosphate cytidylyltransferase